MKFGQAVIPIAVALLLLSDIPGSSGIKCYLDTSGIPEPMPGEVVNTTNFRHFDCSLLGGAEKVRHCHLRGTDLVSLQLWLWIVYIKVNDSL